MEKSELKEAIKRLCKEKNAVIMAHYYTEGDIQDIADMVGDSLALAQWAAKSEADVLVVCGVHFMGETAKILSPQKHVLVPDLNAGCSLADSCDANEFAKFIKAHPNHTVVSYVNTTAAVKALTDVVVTSSNARKIVEALPTDAKIIFAPDRNLGNYINMVTGRNMVLWEGACHVHERFSADAIVKIKAEHPNAQVLVHPECKRPVALLADKIGSTAALLKHAIESDCQEFIVATESGILHEMVKQAPQKTFIPVPPEISEGSIGCSCNECAYMRLNTLEKIYDCLKNNKNEIFVADELREKAVKPILKMLELSK